MISRVSRGAPLSGSQFIMSSSPHSSAEGEATTPASVPSGDAVFDRPTTPSPEVTTPVAPVAVTVVEASAASTPAESPPASPPAEAPADAPVPAPPASAAPVSAAVPSVDVPVDLAPDSVSEVESLPPGAILELISKEPPAPPPRRPTARPPGEELAPMSIVAGAAAHWPPRVVGDVMTRKVITIGENEPIGDLDSRMKQFRFHHLPVVTADMKLVGLITPTDYLHAKLGVGPNGEAIEKADATTVARAIMRRNVVTGTPEAPLATACLVMIQQRLGCFPIIRADGTLIGIVTPTDFVRLAYAFLEPASRGVTG